MTNDGDMVEALSALSKVLMRMIDEVNILTSQEIDHTSYALRGEKPE